MYFKLPINPEINKYYDKVCNESNKWIIENKLVEGIENKFIEWDIPLYTSLAYTRCSLEKLRPLCDYFSWLFLIDDVAEKLNEKDIWKLFKGTLEIIEIDKTNEKDIWSITFLDIWKRMNMSFKNKNELLRSKKEYIQGVINQKKIDFNIDSYIENRNMDVGSKILSTLLKHAYDLEIDEMYTDNISKIMGYCFGLSNDIYSFKNEESYNIVNIIMNEKNNSLEEALLLSYNILQEKIEQLIEICNINSNINTIFLDGLKLIITGTIIWTNNNPRYNYRENIYRDSNTTIIKNYKYNLDIKKLLKVIN